MKAFALMTFLGLASAADSSSDAVIFTAAAAKKAKAKPNY